MTCAASKRKETVWPLMVNSPRDLTNTDEVRREVVSDESFQGARKRLLESNVLQANGSCFGFVKQRGLISRQVVCTSGETKMQFVVPVKYQDAVLYNPRWAYGASKDARAC